MCERRNENNPSRDVFWKEAYSSKRPSETYGPEHDGYCMQVRSTDPGGDAIYENINYCPWCGRKL